MVRETTLLLSVLCSVLSWVTVFCTANQRFVDAHAEEGIAVNEEFKVRDFFTSFVVLFLKAAGPVLFISLQLSTVKTAMEIWRMRAVGKLSSFPFVSLAVCGYFWALYGVMKDDLTIWVPNAAAIATGCFCMICYHRYALQKPTALYVGGLLSVAIATILAYRDDAHRIGMLGSVIAVMVSGSPLAVIRTVVLDKSTAALPFLTSFIAWLNNICWVCYGYFLAGDILIYGPNLVGLTLTTTQMGLFIVYGFSTAQVSTGEAKAVDYKV